MSRRCFNADLLMAELYSNKWMAHFKTATVEKRGEAHRMEVNEEVQRLAKRRQRNVTVM